uniref:C2H2-type domain-containing protein n=1 Tax=Ditylenchus dipsaci TaxID=166011 RepID=A0A915DV14_9BILA
MASIIHKKDLKFQPGSDQVKSARRLRGRLYKLSSISMQQVVNLIEDEDESWPEEAESLSPRVKQARRCKIEFDDDLHSTSFWSSKSYGYRFDLVLRKADNKELGIVKCNLCPATLSKSGTKGLKGHVAFHSGKSVTPSESEFNSSLIKFVTCSAQPFRLSLATTSITIEPFREKNSLVSDLLAIVKLSRIDAYVDVLKPIAEMVIDLQAEKSLLQTKSLAMPLLYGYICKL